jgi:hypothetical protein
MMMRMLATGGVEVFTDGVRLSDVDNPKGYYEHERVKGIAKGDVDWLGEAKGRALKIVSPLLRFLPTDHTYRVILMRRRMSEILASQKLMLEHRDEAPNPMSDAKLAEIYERDLMIVEQWMRGQPNIEALPVSYNGLLEEPRLELLRIERFLDRPLDLEAMQAIIEPNLYRQRIS